MRTHNIGFYEDLTKLSLNYHQISSNTHLISSAGLHSVCLGLSVKKLWSKTFKFHACCNLFMEGMSFSVLG